MSIIYIGTESRHVNGQQRVIGFDANRARIREGRSDTQGMPLFNFLIIEEGKSRLLTEVGRTYPHEIQELFRVAGRSENVDWKFIDGAEFSRLLISYGLVSLPTK